MSIYECDILTKNNLDGLFIPHICDLNAVDTESMIENLEDLDLIIQRELNDTDHLPILDELDIKATISDAITSESKHHFWCPGQTTWRNPQHRNGAYCTERLHLYDASSDKTLNYFGNEIVLTSGDISEMKLWKEKIFENVMMYFTLPSRNLEESTINYEQYIDSKM